MNLPYVLVVEDEPDTRRAVATALRDAAFDTVAVQDGAAGLVACQRRDPAIIILDLAVPGLDGVKFADAYRRIPGSSARIVVVSGTPHGAETAARIRADAYLSKPFEIEGLIARVKALLREAT